MTWRLYAVSRVTDHCTFPFYLAVRHRFMPKAPWTSQASSRKGCGTYCQRRLNRWHDSSHRRAAAEDGLFLSGHLASVGRGSNHDAHDADISLASRSVIFCARRSQHGASPFLANRHFLMMTSVASTLLDFSEEHRASTSWHEGSNFEAAH